MLGMEDTCGGLQRKYVGVNGRSPYPQKVIGSRSSGTLTEDAKEHKTAVGRIRNLCV